MAAAAGRAGARPTPRPPLDPRRWPTRLIALGPARAAAAAAARGHGARSITLEERAAVIRSALRRAPQFVLQDLLATSRDRVVVAVTFLALLELAKGREVAIEQDEPWGPDRMSAGSTPIAGAARG